MLLLVLLRFCLVPAYAGCPGKQAIVVVVCDGFIKWLEQSSKNTDLL